MDRSFAYPAELAADTDILNLGKFAMVGLAYLTQAILGTSTIVDGLACTPGTGLNVSVAPGSVYALDEADATAFGSLGTDSAELMKQGVNYVAQTLATPAPSTVGQSIAYLIEAQYQDIDGGDVVLTYYDSADPSTPYTGPNGNGQSQPTIRRGTCVLQVKAGTAATTGDQTTPTVDAGWVGLWVVTVAYGATGIVTGNIVQASGAPFIPAKLPAIPAAIQNQEFTFGADSGAVNAIVVTTNPGAAELAAGMRLSVTIGHTNTSTAVTLNRDGLGAQPVTVGGAAPAVGALVAGQIVDFEYDGENWQATSGLAAAGGVLAGTYPNPGFAEVAQTVGSPKLLGIAAGSGDATPAFQTLAALGLLFAGSITGGVGTITFLGIMVNLQTFSLGGGGDDTTLTWETAFPTAIWAAFPTSSTPTGYFPGIVATTTGATLTSASGTTATMTGTLLGIGPAT